MAKYLVTLWTRSDLDSLYSFCRRQVQDVPPIQVIVADNAQISLLRRIWRLFCLPGLKHLTLSIPDASTFGPTCLLICAHFKAYM